MIEIKYKTFDELTTRELYQIIQLRIEVFVIEQNCPYQDCDDKDLQSMHLMFWKENKLAAYCRILPPGISYEGYTSIGRVVTHPAFRKQALGKQLMNDAIDRCKHIDPSPIKISAQAYLEKFYQDLGFETISEPYLEDDIPHIAMVMH
ncbi:MAG: GNAT family N-acetyltransferase [Chitinophagaceae bacterium]|nr:GNAT family N-acetyltransferase [Chitinophagaceae bacterium]